MNSKVAIQIATPMMCPHYMGMLHIRNQCISLVDTGTRNQVLPNPNGTQKCPKFVRWLSGDFVAFLQFGHSWTSGPQ